MERLGPRHGSPRLLLVSPTRALANDLKRRLEVRMEDVGVSFGRFTGEHKDRVDGRLPSVLVITPEALDSLLARRPAVLRQLGAVVLDEIHLLDNTPRGDQLRILLQRLDRITDGSIQRVAASATVADPEGLAARYLCRPVVVRAGGRRTIRARSFDGTGPVDVARHLALLVERGFRKVLIFANARNEVERLTAGLHGRTRFHDQVFAHHGSLARRVRERTERLFLEAPAAVCVATLTLELGIDIGTVDYVLLAGAPPGVDSLLQRIGRGSRRGSESRVGYASRHEGERLLFRVELERGACGDLCADPYAFRPGVLVQQALVQAGAEDHVTAEQIVAWLPSDERDAWPLARAAELLERMEKAGLLEATAGHRYVLSEATDRHYQRGLLHGNIEASQDLRVVDRLTGDVVGEIAHRGEVRSSRLQIGGTSRREVHDDGDRVLTDASEGGEPARFRSRPLPGMTFSLAQAVAHALGVEPDRVVQRRTDRGFLLVHGLGSAGGLLLRAVLAPVVGDARILAVSPVTLTLARPLEAWVVPTEADVKTLLTGREKGLARAAGMGPWHRHLPGGVRRDALRGATFLDGVLAYLGRVKLVREDDQPAPRVWELL